VFEGWSHWTWVGIAWAEVVLAYVGYLAYLGWRKRQLLRDDGARALIEREATGGRT
jgi:hypothetical protein